MADNQHRLIKGYRELSEEEISLMNRIKSQGPVLEELVRDIDTYLTNQALSALGDKPDEGNEELSRIDHAQPCLWMEEGRVSLQKGLMFLTRSIAQPTFF